MHRTRMQKRFAAVLAGIALLLIVVGVYGMYMRTSEKGSDMLSTMRIRSILTISGEGVVEALVSEAKKNAQLAVREAGGDMAAVREAVAKAEEETRANTKTSIADYETLNTDSLKAAIIRLEAAQMAYAQQEAKELDAYREAMLAQADMQAQEVDPEPELETLSAEGDLLIDDELLEEETPAIDLSSFVASAELESLQGASDAEYTLLAQALKAIYPELTDEVLQTLKEPIASLIYQSNDKYETQFDRYSTKLSQALSGSDLMLSRIIRYGDDFLTVGIGFIILTLLVLFYHTLLKSLGLPRLIIGMFFVLLCILSVIYDLSISTMLSNTIVRMGMNSILVLAMLPGIQCGISLNLGLSIGIIGGLLGGLLCIEFGMSGWGGFAFAIAVGIVIAAVLGYLYGLLLNRLKGSEMAVTTYVGYSFVSLMCIGWMLLPFNSPLLRWPLGKGLRVTLTLKSAYRHILNNLFSFDIAGITIPTGLLLFMAICCFLVWMFSRSKTGIAMQAVGNNPRFAEATGISVDRMRIIGTVLSTVLGAVGIIVYSQSYGFMQLYTAPRQMGFIAASAILIGGASTSRARISHVLIGAFLFQGVLTLGMPVANVLVPQSTISETMRILISNGIILYALTKSGGASRA